MSDTGDRHDNFPENKTEFKRFEKDERFQRSINNRDWKNSMASSVGRSLKAVRNWKIFPRSK